ncbi:WG repeat-containing protein [Alkalicoccus saliphilus]|uniref:Uncharacterized protein n=1 Tax=Alkalicoccus saliphilus TaxID=200989 RepID=A0A2T4U318_9BACI|nr:WG repeat-containing protein [Alkalicoccus saliphilus]PTL37802.1 hypothetical protein C6Y45_14670 [Alkalicoccus saliphilus]
MNYDRLTVTKKIHSSRTVDFSIVADDKNTYFKRTLLNEEKVSSDDWFENYEKYHLNVSNFKYLPVVTTISTDEEGDPFTLFPYKNGTLLSNKNKMSFNHIEQLLEAVRHLHKKQIAHGHPHENDVWLTEDGGLLLFGAGEMIKDKDAGIKADLQPLISLITNFSNHTFEQPINSNNIHSIEDLQEAIHTTQSEESPGLTEKPEDSPEEVEEHDETGKRSNKKKSGFLTRSRLFLGTVSAAVLLLVAAGFSLLFNGDETPLESASTINNEVDSVEDSVPEEPLYVDDQDYDYMYLIEEEDLYGFVSENGRVQVTPEFEEAKPFTEGLAAVSNGESWGYIDSRGAWVIEPNFDSAYSFSEGLAKVEEGEEVNFINSDGEIVLEAISVDDDSHFSENLLSVEVDGKYGYMNREGELIIEAVYDQAAPFSEELANVTLNGRSQFIDRQGNTAFECEIFQCTESFKEGLTVIEQDGRYGFADDNGEVVIDPAYDDVENFSDNLALVEHRSQFGFIDQTGSVEIPIEYEEAHSFSGGMALVRDSSNYGYINTHNSLVIAADYINAEPFVEGLAYVETESEKAGYINATNEFIWSTSLIDDPVAERINYYEANSLYSFSAQDTEGASHEVYIFTDAEDAEDTEMGEVESSGRLNIAAASESFTSELALDSPTKEEYLTFSTNTEWIYSVPGDNPSNTSIIAVTYPENSNINIGSFYYIKEEEVTPIIIEFSEGDIGNEMYLSGSMEYTGNGIYETIIFNNATYNQEQTIEWEFDKSDGTLTQLSNESEGEETFPEGNDSETDGLDGENFNNDSNGNGSYFNDQNDLNEDQFNGNNTLNDEYEEDYTFEFEAEESVSEDEANVMLYQAAVAGDISLIENALEMGAEINAFLSNEHNFDHGEKTALTAATENNNNDAVDYLLENGADPNIIYENGRSALETAVREDNPSIISTLIANGADINFVYYESNEKTLLHLGVDTDYSTNTLKALIEEGADLNARDMNGNTPLITAANNYNYNYDYIEEGAENSLAKAQLLIEAGADINLKNYEGETAYDQIHFEDSELSLYLESQGANE